MTSVPQENNVADILIESLPYIQQFSGKNLVIKYGGHAMVDTQLKKEFARDITLLKLIGMNPVVVHGGGPQINSVLEKMGMTSTFVRGMRMTDRETMDVVEMVLGGKVNKEIVAQINLQGGKAVGLSGKDGELIQARKLTMIQKAGESTPPEIIDPGHVGEVTRINPELINSLSQQGFIPVIAPVGSGPSGETYNINADLVAACVAKAISATRLILLTDVDGVLDNEKKRVSSITATEIQKFVDTGIISGGMIPKIECGVNALSSGVEKVHIINGTRRHSLLLELFTNEGIGTEVILPSKTASN